MTANIFASVAAYNDPDLPRTLDTMLSGSRHSLRVAVVLQTDDHALSTAVRAYPVEVLEIPLGAARGPCWARAVAQDMYRGEDWLYHCDAHMVFADGWDADLIAQAGMIGERSVLSSYQLDTAAAGGGATVMDFQEWGDCGIRWQAHIWSLDAFGGVPAPARAISGHSLFAPGRFVEEVPYDPRIYFSGEETSLTVRAWTAGYDLYHPAATICRHRYNRLPGTTHWEHDPDWWRVQEASRRRVARLYGWLPGWRSLACTASVASARWWSTSVGPEWISPREPRCLMTNGGAP